ncbi:Uncharacterised protein [Acinetobacter baumannii]|uniref:Uncharacterized protein n=1 Tax=Amycolatopsis camponoti TaxID=2606593 RepID=A0A6I8MC99_9PSEU|nr:Uncharacterised protein [Acinetobacter baumannii]VVJ25403.1 Uncharacterised protein [Amycolatopsis camponoti]
MLNGICLQINFQNSLKWVAIHKEQKATNSLLYVLLRCYKIPLNSKSYTHT